MIHIIPAIISWLCFRLCRWFLCLLLWLRVNFISWMRNAPIGWNSTRSPPVRPRSWCRSNSRLVCIWLPIILLFWSRRLFLRWCICTFLWLRCFLLCHRWFFFLPFRLFFRSFRSLLFRLGLCSCLCHRPLFFFHVFDICRMDSKQLLVSLHLCAGIRKRWRCLDALLEVRFEVETNLVPVDWSMTADEDEFLLLTRDCQ